MTCKSSKLTGVKFAGLKLVNVTKESKIKTADLEDYNRARMGVEANEFYKKKSMVR